MEAQKVPKLSRERFFELKIFRFCHLRRGSNLEQKKSVLWLTKKKRKENLFREIEQMKQGAQAQYNFPPKERTETKVSQNKKKLYQKPPLIMLHIVHCSLLPHFNFKFDVARACCQRQHS